MRDTVQDARDNLHPATSDPNNSNALVAEVESFGEVRRVTQTTLEGLNALDFRPSPGTKACNQLEGQVIQGLN